MNRARAKTIAMLSPTLDFMRLLWSVDHALATRSKRMAKGHGITGVERLVVRALGHMPGASPGEIAELLHLHPSTLTDVFRRLCDRKIIVREKDPSDARRARLALTVRGRAVDRLDGGTVEAAVRRALRRLDPLDVEASRRVLRTLADELAREDR